MPILSLKQIVSRATQMTGVNVSWLPSEVSFFANIAYGTVSQAAGLQHTPKEAIAVSSTTSGGNRIALPSDFDYAIGLTVGIPNSWSTATSRTTTWEPLAKHDTNWADTFVGNLEGGEPEAYAETATWFELVPSPNSAYSTQLRYMTKATELVASTSTPVLDEQWHWAIVLKTAELLGGASGNTTAEWLNRSRYNAYMNSVRADQGKKLMDRRGARVAYVRKLT